MTLPLNTHSSNSFSVSIIVDDSPDSPREWDNLGTLTCWHRRYRLGEDHDFDSPDALYSHLAGYKSSDRQGAYQKAKQRHIILPVYMYDHSGLALSTTPFSCRWDSGQLGYIWASHRQICDYFSVKRMSKRIRESAIAALNTEIETYGQYVNGEVYGYRILDASSHEVDSCYGFYGADSCQQAADEALRHYQATQTSISLH